MCQHRKGRREEERRACFHQPSAQMGPPWAAERRALFHLHNGPPAVRNWPPREGWLGALYEGAHALWLVGQTAMSVGGSGSGQREGRSGLLPGGSRQGPSPEPGILPGGFPAGMRGLSRGALLRGTGPPSSDRPPQDRAEGISQSPCPEACEPPALSLGLPLGMAAAEGVGGEWCAEKGLFYCKYLESTS